MLPNCLVLLLIALRGSWSEVARKMDGAAEALPLWLKAPQFALRSSHQFVPAERMNQWLTLLDLCEHISPLRYHRHFFCWAMSKTSHLQFWITGTYFCS